MEKQHTNARKSIPIETGIAIAIHRLSTCDLIPSIADTYGVGTSTVQGIIMQFCQVVRHVLHDRYISWPSSLRMKKLVQDFEALRGLDYVIGAVDESHISIIAPHKNQVDYYCRKGFHSCLLQVVVDATTVTAAPRPNIA